MKSPPKIILNSDLVTVVADADPPKDDDQEEAPSHPEEPAQAETVKEQLSQDEDEDEEVSKSEVNEKLTEEITDRILAQVLQEELSETDLKQVFTRQVPKPKPTESIIKSNKAQVSSPGGSRVRSESPPMLEVAVTSETNFNINQSISVDQIIAGVDTSLEAVDQYVEGIFAQIRIRAKQFMNAFYTPIYRNPINVLTKIQKQGIATPPQPAADKDDDKD